MAPSIKCRNVRCESHGPKEPMFTTTIQVNSFKKILKETNTIKAQYFKCVYCGDIAINND